MKRRLILQGSLTLVSAAAFMTLAFAQGEYPNKPITLIVPYPPGGATDAVTRKLGENLQKFLAQTVIVENRGGAGGTIGAGYVAKAAPDGYTLLMGTTGPTSIAGSLYKQLPYDPARSFAPVSLIATAPLVLLAKPAWSVKSLGDYIALAKSRPDTVTYATPGKGTTMHLVGVMLGMDTGARLVHVPYKGSGQALQDLLGGQVDSMFNDPMLQVLSHVRAGTLKALAVTSAKRHPLLADVPTVAESGFPGFEAMSWHALFAPAGTPPPVLDRLYAGVSRALDEPDMLEHFKSLGSIIEGRSPAATRKFVLSEIDKWGRIVRQMGGAID